MAEIILFVVVLGFMLYLFSWRIPVIIFKLLVVSGVIIGIGVLIGFGFNLVSNIP